MSRAFLIVMDSVGIGGAPDAHAFFNDGRPDTGANTVGHIAQARPPRMPVLDGLGLGAAVRLASGALESSNVNVVDAMVGMIALSRQFEMQMKMLQTADQNAQRAQSLLSLRG